MFLLLTLMLFSEPRTLVVGVDAADFTATLALAQDGDTLLVPEGVWAGGVVNKTLTIRGTGGSLDGGGVGTVLTLNAPNIVVENLFVTNGGLDLFAPDHGIFVTKAATGSVLRNNRVSHCAFAIWIHETDSVRLLGNQVEGTLLGHTSNRGNGIQLFNASHLEVRGNHVSGGRDGIYVSATEDSVIAENIIENTRYGVHYMFSYDNQILGNITRNNTIGLALMQSKNLLVTDNQALNNSRNGILFRDAQNCEIRHNLLKDNGEGLFFYSSTDNRITANRIEGNEVGVKVWAGSFRNDVSRNLFINNSKQVFFVGTADLFWGEQSGGNYWSDYLGWDQNGDGKGDRPYRINSFSSHLLYTYPASVLLMRSPSLELLSHLESRLPVFKVPTLVDVAPLMEIPDENTFIAQGHR